MHMNNKTDQATWTMKQIMSQNKQGLPDILESSCLSSRSINLKPYEK